jgi:hypothetical protein
MQPASEFRVYIRLAESECCVLRSYLNYNGNGGSSALGEIGGAPAVVSIHGPSMTKVHHNLHLFGQIDASSPVHLRHVNYP